MKILIQRVKQASVEVNNQTIGKINQGLCLLVGFGKDDQTDILQAMAEKVYNMRIFANDAGRFDLSCKDIQGEILIVPQFTLYADTTKGRRPEFFSAKTPTEAKELFIKFTEIFTKIAPDKVASGEFGANMQVHIQNDGPVTIMLS